MFFRRAAYTGKTKAEQDYDVVSAFFISDEDYAHFGANCIPDEIKEKMESIIANGSPTTSEWMTQLYLSYCLDGRVKGVTVEEALERMESTYQEPTSLPDGCMNRIINMEPSETTLKYVLLLINKYEKYMVLEDLYRFFFESEVFKDQEKKLRDILFPMLMDALENSITEKAKHIIGFLLLEAGKHTLINEELHLEMLDNAMLSEYWQEKHTDIIKTFFNKYAQSNPELIKKMNSRFHFLSDDKLQELSSSQSLRT